MNKLATAFALGGLMAGGLFTAAPAHAEVKAVVELFTSQGCSSCPPADKLLGEYAERPDVLALSFNVDYWDYLGWKDTLASPDNTQRQRNYAQARGDGQVYTPQAVIDGQTHVVGSSKTRIETALQRHAGGLPVTLSLTPTDDAITVEITGADKSDMPHATLWLVMYERSVTVPIGRGENTGRTITYNNVVRKLRPVAMWKGDGMTVDLPKSEFKHADVDRCAVLLQAETKAGLPGAILGAATITMAGS